MGHETAVAFDAPEAIEIATKFQPEIALLDIGLPAMDGYDLARELVERGVRPSMLVAISGFGLEADHQRSAEAGFTAHLVKPIKMQMLRELLARHRS